MKGGGDRNRVSVDDCAGYCDPADLRFLCASPITPEPWLAYSESRFLLVLDEPDGVPGLFELLLPACEVGGCQWWK